MKTLSLGILAVVSLTSVRAQFQQGDVELALSGTVGAWSTSYTFGQQTNSESRNVLMLGITTGYFLTDGFSVEPEFVFMAVEKQSPGHSILANVSYTYFGAESKVAPFVRVGYGISNSFSFMGNQSFLSRVSDKLDVTVLQAGGGIKVLVATGAAIRLELNYKNQSFTREDPGFFGSGSFETKMGNTYVGLLVGLSVLL